MDVVYEFLITLFESLGLYSCQGGLAEHLRGMDIKCKNYSNQSIYSIVFLCIVIVDSIILVNYYFGLLNRIPFNRVWWWIINLLIGSTIVFITAFLYSNNDLETNNICNQLKVTTSDCWGFAITAAIYSIIWSILLSVLIKWKSSVNKKVPF